MTKIEFGNSMCLQEEGICFWTLGYALKVCLSLSFVCGSCKPLKKKPCTRIIFLFPASALFGVVPGTKRKGN